MRWEFGRRLTDASPVWRSALCLDRHGELRSDEHGAFGVCPNGHKLQRASRFDSLLALTYSSECDKCGRILVTEKDKSLFSRVPVLMCRSCRHFVCASCKAWELAAVESLPFQCAIRDGFWSLSGDDVSFVTEPYLRVAFSFAKLIHNEVSWGTRILAMLLTSFLFPDEVVRLLRSKSTMADLKNIPQDATVEFNGSVSNAIDHFTNHTLDKRTVRIWSKRVKKWYSNRDSSDKTQFFIEEPSPKSAVNATSEFSSSVSAAKRHFEDNPEDTRLVRVYSNRTKRWFINRDPSDRALFVLDA